MGKVRVADGETWDELAARTSGEASVAGIIAANGGKADEDPESGSQVEVPGYGMENDTDTQNAVPDPE